MTTPAIVANTEEVQNLATQFTLASNHAGEVAVAVNSGMGLADLAISTVVDPIGAARFEATALHLLTGPFGLHVLEQHFMSICNDLGYAARDYMNAELAIWTFPYRFVFGMPAGVVDAVNGFRSGSGFLGRFGDAGEDFLAGDSAVTDTAEAFVPILSDVYSSSLWHDGRGTLRDVGPDTHLTQAPTSAADLVNNLAILDGHRTKKAGNFDIQFEAGTDAAGHPQRKVFVYLPGTDQPSAITGHDAENGRADLSAVTGRDTAYEDGLFAAMRAAGVTAADDVIIVGHSEGGMVAVNAAKDAYRDGTFNISQILTLGSPIGIIARGLPPTTTVLAIENKDDVMPKLDGTANPSGPNIATVKINKGPDNTSSWGGILDQHDMEKSYQTGVDSLEATGNEAVRSFDNGLNPLANAKVSTEEYGVTRQ